jgi:hypothetical protein
MPTVITLPAANNKQWVIREITLKPRAEEKS